MKIIISFFLACSLFLYSCSNAGKSSEKPSGKDTVAQQKFFPVTEYLKGEIFNIKNTGINPLKYTVVNGVTDSVWLKLEQLDSAFSEFLHPQIDSVNLIAYFTESNFMDQSLNAATFTYDPSGNLPDSMKLKHWDVYIDPKTSKVKRVYLVKQPDKNKTLQLTWISGQSCKITTITIDERGEMKAGKEEKIIWDF